MVVASWDETPAAMRVPTPWLRWCSAAAACPTTVPIALLLS